MNIEAKDLSKVYNSGENRVIALDHANLEIVSSDFISIMGPSGSGKRYLQLQRQRAVCLSPQTDRVYFSAIQPASRSDSKREHYYATFAG